jgi:hypothetical protein
MAQVIMEIQVDTETGDYHISKNVSHMGACKIFKLLIKALELDESDELINKSLGNVE